MRNKVDECLVDRARGEGASYSRSWLGVHLTNTFGLVHHRKPQCSCDRTIYLGKRSDRVQGGSI